MENIGKTKCWLQNMDVSSAFHRIQKIVFTTEMDVWSLQSWDVASKEKHMSKTSVGSTMMWSSMLFLKASEKKMTLFMANVSVISNPVGTWDFWYFCHVPWWQPCGGPALAEFRLIWHFTYNLHRESQQMGRASLAVAFDIVWLIGSKSASKFGSYRTTKT